MLIIWLVVIVLVVAVAIMFWMLMKKQQHQNVDALVIQQLENKVESLELNLQKTLEIMQDLARKMNVQQEVLDINAQKIKQVETQNVELVSLLAKVVNPKS
ncbi:MAG: hypothetical protein KA474_02685 [Acinetobacter sp.]|nr:hypothetical protein [Acinetobacter sp.]